MEVYSTSSSLHSSRSFSLSIILLYRDLCVTLHPINILSVTFVEEFGCLQPHKKMLKLQNPPQILRLLGVIPR